MKKYIISGMEPNVGGAGLFFSYLISINKTHKIVYRRNDLIRNKNTQIYVTLNQILRKLRINRLIFWIELLFINDGEVILLHPQYIGYELFIKLLKRNRIIKWYILDNGFFCISSYNFNLQTQNECLKCLGNICPDSICKVYPVNYDRIKTIEYMNEISLLSHKILFYLQNKKQEELIKLHYGSSVNSRIIGMRTCELIGYNILHNERNSKLIVYHGSLSVPKGLNYIIRLICQMENFSLLIPFKKESVQKIYTECFPRNIIFNEITWETGLKQYIEEASLVLCPSIWSAPIEGALIKSLYYNGNVAIMDTKYGFQNEIPNEFITKLTGEISYDKGLIEKNLNKGTAERKKVHDWVENLINQFNIDSLLE